MEISTISYMQKIKYLIRLDDACPYMDRAKWQRMEDILDKYGVKPLVGIIPANADPKTMIELEDPTFWEKAHSWERKGWQIALHGYDHCYISEKGMYGLNPMWGRSEFSGVSLDKQKGKIRKGVGILKDHGLEAKYFFAPSHTFDENTLTALEEESNIRIISDTIATIPYKIGEFAIIPQMGGHCTKMVIPGYWTFCLHPNMMTEDNFIQTDSFIKENNANFIAFDDLNLRGVKKKSLFSRFLSWLYFTQRKIRGIR